MYDKRNVDKNIVKQVVERESAADDFKNVVFEPGLNLSEAFEDEPVELRSGAQIGGLLRVVSA